MSAKHYENPTMLSKVTAKNVGEVFLRHTVVPHRSHANDWDLVRACTVLCRPNRVSSQTFTMHRCTFEAAQSTVYRVGHRIHTRWCIRLLYVHRTNPSTERFSTSV